jgi:tetratricopeptide (TPR) repeat protein
MTAGLLEQNLVAPSRSTNVVPFADAPATTGPATPVEEPTFPSTLEPGYLAQARALADRYADAQTAWARLAHAELQAGNLPEALNAARRTVALAATGDTDIPAIVVAAQILAAHDLVDEADAALASLPAHLIPTIPLLAELAVRRNEPDVALARLGSDNSPISRSIRGWLFLQQRRYGDAIRELRASSIAAPSPSSSINLGYAYAAIGAYRKAIRATEIATGLAPAGLTAGFNLVSYFVASGDLERADAELRRMATLHPKELKVDFAAATVKAKTGDVSGALSRLRGARSRAGWGAPADDFCELQGNIAFLEWRTGQRTRVDTCTYLHKLLIKTNHRSLGIAGLMAHLMWRFSDAKQFAAVYEALLRTHSEDAMLGLAAHRALLARDYDTAAEFAVRWASASPFEENAVILATYLLSDARGDFEGAAILGAKALRRVPNSVVLANNVAYAYIMLGDLDKARRYLPFVDESPLVRATKGLLLLASGRRADGLAQYEQAAELADKLGDAPLAAAIRYKASLVNMCSVRNVHVDHLPPPPEEYADDARFELHKRCAETAKVPLPTSSDSEQLPLFQDPRRR